MARLAQLAPPSEVVTTTPPAPAAKHTLVLGQLTELRRETDPALSAFHVDPELVVSMTVPPPTAKQVVVLGHDTPSRVVAPTVATCVGSMLVGVRAASMSSAERNRSAGSLRRQRSTAPARSASTPVRADLRGAGGVVPAMVAGGPSQDRPHDLA